MKRLLSRLVLVVAVSTSGCSYGLWRTAPEGGVTQNDLWIAPSDIGERDLFAGPGGADTKPPELTFKFVSLDTTGASRGYDVLDTHDGKWSVKLGIEAQPEIVVSRLLWAIGFHQPPTVYVEKWTLVGGPESTGPLPPARFRPEIKGYKVAGDWSWFENPFVGTRPFEGLIAANVLLGNWDFKTSNNKLYEHKEGGSTEGPSRLYVVRDLGGSLGKASQPALLRVTGTIRSMPGTKNDIAGFEEQGFVTLGSNGKPKFGYRGVRRDLLDAVTAESVVWTCRLMSQLSDKQMADAFRAANYTPELTKRYIMRIRQKIAEGLALAGSRTAALDTSARPQYDR